MNTNGNITTDFETFFPNRGYLKPCILKCERFIQRHHKFLKVNSTEGHFVKSDCQKDEV